MSLYHLQCACGWSGYRTSPDPGLKKCPQCRTPGFVVTQVPEGEAVTTTMKSGIVVKWDWNANTWVKA